MSEQDSPQITQQFATQRPTSDRPEEWQAYWKTQKQAWRTEVEINQQHQAKLRSHLDIMPDIERGIYPFKDVQLSRADVEWLLANHDDGLGPVDLDQDGHNERRGLDLRGARLHKVNLTYLPLTRLYGGLTLEEGFNVSAQARQDAAIDLEECDLSWAHLEQATLAKANLDKAVLLATHLENSDLGTASLSCAGKSISRSSCQQSICVRAFSVPRQSSKTPISATRSTVSSPSPMSTGTVSI